MFITNIVITRSQPNWSQCVKAISKAIIYGKMATIYGKTFMN